MLRPRHLGYIAVDGGVRGLVNRIVFETGINRPRGLTLIGDGFSLGARVFHESPHFAYAHANTEFGANPFAIRMRRVNEEGFEAMLQEEQSLDPETSPWCRRRWIRGF